ncbi:unnamed protein product, partial [Ixodes pacificus]
IKPEYLEATPLPNVQFNSKTPPSFCLWTTCTSEPNQQHAAVERVFRQVNLVKTKQRKRLSTDALCGLLQAKRALA